MKHKLSKILGVGLTLALLISMLVTAAPVSADADVVTDVWVEFTSDTHLNKKGTALEYTIHFTPDTALERGVDTITVAFPDAIDLTMGAANFDLTGVDADAADYIFGSAAVAATEDGTFRHGVANRVTMTTPVDLAADVATTLVISADAAIVSAATAGTYYIKLSTSQDTTTVLSSAFVLGDATEAVSNIDSVGSYPSSLVAGHTAAYLFEFNPAHIVPIGGTVTVEFPVGTDLSSTSLVADNVVVGAVSANAAVDLIDLHATDVSVNTAARTVTATTAIATGTGTGNGYILFTSVAGIKNPTIEGAKDIYMWTSTDRLKVEAGSLYEIVAGAASKLAFVAATSDNATIVNAFTTVIKLESHDQYGNLKEADTTTTVKVESDGTGTVHTAAGGSSDLWGDSQTHGSGTDDVFYRPTVVGTGTHTLTATVVTGDDLAAATFDISVVPKVALTDSDSNELNTYGPASSDYTAGIVSGTYIQNAIDAAGAGDTVTLGDGIYEVSSSGLTVDKAITVTSVNGRDSTTIRMTYNVAAYLFTLSSRSTISGLHLKGYLPGETHDFDKEQYGVRVGASGAAANYGYVKDCKVEGFKSGICTADSAVNYWKIQDNVIDNCKIGIYANNVTNWTISGNTITNYMFGIGGLWTTMTSVAIKNNSLNGITSSVLTAILKMAANQQGIELHVSSATLVITQNTFTGNDYGIKLGADAADTLVKYNDFIDNNLFGIGASGNYAVTALYNWWGDATGPSTGSGTYKSTATGSGDAISADVASYKPWLHIKATGLTPSVVADNASYPTFKRSLVVGWNTLSVPAKLIAAANTLDELVPTGWGDIAYKYSGKWVEVIGTDVINPLDGIYIKMISAQTVLFKVDGAALSAPAKSLAEGWNLIGLASLATKEDLEVVDLLPSASFGQLVSPSVNAGDPWALTPSIAAIGTHSQGNLVIGEGYWLFMKSAATMGGFDVLPLVPSLN